MLPVALQDYEVELVGRLVVGDAPGVEIKGLREHFGFKQEDLANLLGLRRESLSRIEGGHVDLSLDFLRSFSKIMTLAKGVREHIARQPPGAPPDESYLELLVAGLRIDRQVAEEVILQSTLAFEAKRRDALAPLKPNPLWREARPQRGAPRDLP